MPKLSELIADEAPLTVRFRGGDLQLVYRPRVVTPKWQHTIILAERQGDDDEAMLYGPLKDALLSWDLEQDDGSPCPITSEAMENVSRAVLTGILLAVISDARPNSMRLPAPSTDGSSEPSAPAKTRRTGTS
ncbi:MAG: hypothetical protein AB7P40_20825 [Chloroflexota bacterium]